MVPKNNAGKLTSQPQSVLAITDTADNHDSNPDAPVCWICLSDHGALNPQCGCPSSRVAHDQCVWQWRFTRAGTCEEHSCRFCEQAYAPLIEAWPELQRAPAPVMTLNVQGDKHAVPVAGGEWGRVLFEADVRRLYRLAPGEDVDISFSCVVPGTDMKVILAGWKAYDAAHMAAAIACAAAVKEGEVQEEPPHGLLQRMMRFFEAAPPHN